MSIVCEMAAPFVANAAVEGTEVARPFRDHTTTCLKCQARHTAMTRTARQLRGLAGERTVAPADLEWRVMSSLEGDLAVTRSWKRPVTLLAALLSMAAALIIWRLRPKVTA
jgi:hypothetical protein